MCLFVCVWCGVVTLTEKNDLEMLTEINVNFHIENILRGMTPKIANLSLQIIHKQTENYLLLCNDFLFLPHSTYGDYCWRIY